MTCERGAILDKAKAIINGERQDAYGKPEDAFAVIGAYWTTYLGSKLQPGASVSAGDVSLLMVLLKIAREAHQHKEDNLVDAAGYLALYADMAAGEGNP